MPERPFGSLLWTIKTLTPLALALCMAAACQASGVNLLENGGFEKDADGDGVADGWVAETVNFSREKVEDVRAYIDKLPPMEELLKGKQILAADGATVVWERGADGKWPALEGYWYGDTTSWYQTLRDQELPQSSRHGELPLPKDLNLGEVTLVLSPKQKAQVMSKPVTVKPDTGYRLTFWVRASGGGDYDRFAQVLDATAADPNSISPFEDHYATPQVLNALPATYWYGSGIAGRYWARFELPFRTGPKCDKIVIRLPFNLREEAERRKSQTLGYRMWYDDFQLIEDNSAQIGDVGYTAKPPAEWPTAAVQRGFVTAARPALPLTYGSYVPDVKEVDSAITLTLAAGETDSAVLVVRNVLADEVVVQASSASELKSDAGHGLHNGYGARFVTVRAVELEWRRSDAKRYVYTPKFLLNTSQLAVKSGQAGQYWVSVMVPPGTPAGEYTGSVKIARVKPDGGDSSAKELKVPLKVTVRAFALEEPRVAFFTWYHTAPTDGPSGGPDALPGAEEIYLADQRRHGMNTVATYCYGERKDKDGAPRASLNELDAVVEQVRRAGLCKDQPLLLYTWRDGGTWGDFAGGARTVAEISEHGKKAGWPDFLLAVSDEPASDKLAAQVTHVMDNQYAELRKKGVRTTTATGRWGALTRPLDTQGRTLGELYDVWIEAMSGQDWPAMHKAADKHHAQLWMYNCWTTGAGYLQERFYSGLWTWRTGAKGNGVWSYGWYVRINNSGIPESKIAWEGRAAGVNDYRYLQTLENTIAAAEGAGKTSAAVQAAKQYLEDLRQRVPYTAYRAYPGNFPQNQWAELDAWNPVPQIQPQDYDGIREQCAQHIIAIRKAS